MNLSTENTKTASLRYGLHQSLTGKKKHLRKNVALELETLARVFDAHITHTEKESYHEYLRSATNFITKNANSNIDNTYKSLSNLINKRILLF